VRIALVTGSHAVDRQDRVDLPLVDALTDAGIDLGRPVWHDPAVDWADFDLVVVRTTWDYTPRRDEFVAWAAGVAERTRLVNPADVLRWNTHKSYLIELEERGAPVVPTAWVARGDRIDLAALLDRRGWARAIVKPAVSSGSDGLERVDDDAASRERGQAHLDALTAAGDVMVQPYLAAIESVGELSVVVIDGAVTHAVRKRPRAGEFRIQEQHGGRYSVEDVDDAVAELARWVVRASGADLMLARVDLVEDDAGVLQLAELEATEPDLYLELSDAGTAALAEAIIARARPGGSAGANE